jgi:hypothetical protein
MKISKINIEYQLKSVKMFCEEHGLDETTIYNLLKRKILSYKNFTL